MCAPKEPNDPYSAEKINPHVTCRMLQIPVEERFTPVNCQCPYPVPTFWSCIAVSTWMQFGFLPTLALAKSQRRREAAACNNQARFHTHRCVHATTWLGFCARAAETRPPAPEPRDRSHIASSRRRMPCGSSRSPPSRICRTFQTTPAARKCTCCRAGSCRSRCSGVHRLNGESGKPVARSPEWILMLVPEHASTLCMVSRMCISRPTRHVVGMD
eukprot:353536-Chlamydomonas_euryale.AAC.6